MSLLLLFNDADAAPSVNVIRATLTTTPVAVCEATGLTHRGRQRIKARVFASGTGPYYCRLAWRIGSGSWSRNAWATPLDDVFSEVDLGLVRVPKGSIGTLTLRVEAYSATSADTLDVDYLLLLPTAKYARAKTPSATTIPTPAVFTASDAFNQTAGTLNAKTADIGGAWTTAGSATDLAVVAGSTHNLQRSTLSDASPRFAVIGSAIGAQVASILVNLSSDIGGAGFTRLGCVARYVNTSNYLVAYASTTTSGTTIVVDEVVAGVTVNLYTSDISTVVPQNVQFQLCAIGGAWFCAYAIGSASLVLMANGYRTNLASGGALASGKSGIYDYNSFSGAVTRTYDNFLVWVPDVQQVVNASGAITIDHNSIQRSDGTRPLEFTGRYLTSPPAGREDRVPRLAVKLRRSDVDVLPDDQIADAQRVDITVTPRVTLI